jgi:hypothetical protein
MPDEERLEYVQVLFDQCRQWLEAERNRLENPTAGVDPQILQSYPQTGQGPIFVDTAPNPMNPGLSIPPFPTSMMGMGPSVQHQHQTRQAARYPTQEFPSQFRQRGGFPSEGCQ